MKHALAAALFALLLSSGCETPPPTPAAPEAATTPAAPVAAGLVFEATYVNFGNIKSNAGIQAATFTAVNRSDRTVHILDLSATCGCILPHTPQREAPPGAALVIPLKLDPLGESGRITHKLTLRTDERDPLHVLFMTADVERVRGADEPYIHVASLVQGGTVQASVVVMSASDVLADASLTFNESIFRFDHVEVDGATLTLDLGVPESAPPGPKEALLRVHRPNGQVAAVIRVSAMVEGPYAWKRSGFMGRMRQGEEARRTVELRSNRGPMPPVRSARLVRAPAEAAEVHVTPGTDAIHLEVVIHPEKLPPGAFQDTLFVELEDKEHPRAALPVNGFIAQP